jgi:hypothetical protein
LLSPRKWGKPLRKNDRGGIAASPAEIADPRNLMLQAFSLSWFSSHRCESPHHADVEEPFPMKRELKAA